MSKNVYCEISWKTAYVKSVFKSESVYKDGEWYYYPIALSHQNRNVLHELLGEMLKTKRNENLCIKYGTKDLTLTIKRPTIFDKIWVRLWKIKFPE